VSELRKKYPDYHISKNKIELSDKMNVDDILKQIAGKFYGLPVNTIDGIKIDFPDGWVHLRKSNTEPIIRIYAESTSKEKADEKASLIMEEISKITC
jgi:phosphomannomutase